MASLLSYFGWGAGATTPAVDEKSPTRALPVSWYTSKEMFDLERRAIFSRKWLLITHRSRLTQPGDWLRYTISGFAFVLCRDREGNINAFHNVCRHRAYPVVEGNAGSAKIFACRYHGWSYGLNGKLAKAPGYQELDDFDKSKNSLFPIHVHIDNNGFIWINMDAKPKPELAWEDDFEAVNKSEELEHYNFDDYTFDHTWEMDGEFNWKVLADNYNESYYSHEAHQDLEKSTGDIDESSVTVDASVIQHKSSGLSTDKEEAKDLDVTATYFFPNSSINVSPHFLLIQRFDPNTPTTSTARYEVYRNRNSSNDSFQNINQLYKRILAEDKSLCEATQKNMTEGGAFVSGELHPQLEKGPLYFQKVCRESVVGWHQREEKEKREIWPARQTLPSDTRGGVSQEDVEFCKGLACDTSVQSKLEW